MSHQWSFFLPYNSTGYYLSQKQNTLMNSWVLCESVTDIAKNQFRKRHHDCPDLMAIDGRIICLAGLSYIYLTEFSLLFKYLVHHLCLCLFTVWAFSDENGKKKVQLIGTFNVVF